MVKLIICFVIVTFIILFAFIAPDGANFNSFNNNIKYAEVQLGPWKSGKLQLSEKYVYNEDQELTNYEYTLHWIGEKEKVVVYKTVVASDYPLIYIDDNEDLYLIDKRIDGMYDLVSFDNAKNRKFNRTTSSIEKINMIKVNIVYGSGSEKKLNVKRWQSNAADTVDKSK